MAEIIRIVLPSEANNSTPVAQSNTESGASSSGGTGSGDGALTVKDAVRAAKTVVAYTGIKQIANSVISYEVSTVNLRTAPRSISRKCSSRTARVRRRSAPSGLSSWAGSWADPSARASLPQGWGFPIS